MKQIGILAIQGDFAKHKDMIRSLGHSALEIRIPEQLADTDALIIPGGESTTFVKIFSMSDFTRQIKAYAQNHPIMGTCAGLIILAREVDNLPAEPLNLIDISVARNAYGRQRESFIDKVSISLNGTSQEFGGVFIRAPKIIQTGLAVKIMGTHNGDVVLVRENNILACTFHPELTSDPAIHKYFIDNFI